MRFQAGLYLAGALLGVVWLLQSPGDGHQRLAMGALAGVDLVIGMALLLPTWRREPRLARTWLLPAVFIIVATVQGLVSLQPNMFALFSMLSFVWIGVTQPRWTSLKLSPLLAGSCLLILLNGAFTMAIGLEATAGVIASVVVGETIAWVSQQLRANEAALRARDVRFRALVQHSSDIVLITDPDTAITYLSPSIATILGYDREHLSGRKLTELVHPEDVSELLAPCPELLGAAGRACTVATRWYHADGSLRYMDSVVTNLLDQPDVGGLVFNTRDVTEQKALEQQLTEQAFHDELTGLANRALLMDRIEHALSGAARRDNADALLFLDLDDFKDVNDALGHSAGDEVLVTVAARLRMHVRPEDTVARFGGDEFAVLLVDMEQRTAVTAVAERIIDALREPFVVADTTVQLGVSVGVAFRSPPDEAEQLLRNADVAMYAAKTRGGGCVVFEDVMHQQLVSRLQLETDLRNAVERGELVLWYQPVVDLRDERVVGVEALLRWRHPERGIVSPDAFLPTAEHSGLIVPIGRWVLRHACAQAASWIDTGLVDPDFSVAVNVSARQFDDPQLVADVRAALAGSELPPGLLVVELTESLMLDEDHDEIDVLEALRSLGVRLAIDDFGTGYSSLSYVRRLPIDVLKIDKAFVDGIGPGTQQLAVAQTIVRLADTLGLETIAEGVEDAQQAETLRRLGCDLAQGYHYARPTDAHTLARLLRGDVSGRAVRAVAGG